MRTRVIALYVCLAGAVLLAQGQPASPPPQSTFRGGVHFVRVDMYASRDGVPIADLQTGDVELLEDGVPQKIVAFERIEIPTGGPEATRVEPNTIRAGQQAAADPRARVFILYLDSYHMDAQTAVQASGPIRRFLEEALGPDDLVAVMMPEMTVSDLTFTRRTNGIAGILEKVDAWMLRDWEASATLRPFTLDATERLYEECYNRTPSEARWMIARKREKRSLEALEELALHLGLIREERKTVLVVTLGWPMSGPEPERAAKKGTTYQPIPSVNELVRGRGREGTDELSNVTVPNSASAPLVCEADRYALANLDLRERMRDITGVANRANVSFYPITPLRNTTQRSDGTTQLSYVRQLAEDTDGLAIVNTNNIAEPLQRVISDMSSYYLLGYESTNARLDGRFRTIKVSVKRANVQIRARKGYRAALAADVATSAAVKSSAPRADESVTRALTSVIGSATPVPLRLKASAWTRAPGGAALVWIAGEIDAGTRRDPGWSSGATAEISMQGANGSASERRTVALGAGAFAFAARIPETGTLAPDQYTVRVSLRASNSGSTVADSTIVTVPGSPSSLGEPLLLRRNPSTGTRYVETADQRFARNERLRLELPTASTAAAAARVVDRAGQTTQVPAQVSARADASGDFQWVVVDVTLAPFAPGDYAVVVSLEGTTQVVGFRVTP